MQGLLSPMNLAQIEKICREYVFSLPLEALPTVIDGFVRFWRYWREPM